MLIVLSFFSNKYIFLVDTNVPFFAQNTLKKCRFYIFSADFYVKSKKTCNFAS